MLLRTTKVLVEIEIFSNIVLFNPLAPVPAVTSLGLSSTSHRFHLYSTSAGVKDLSNDVQIRVIGLMEPEICTKNVPKS